VRRAEGGELFSGPVNAPENRTSDFLGLGSYVSIIITVLEWWFIERRLSALIPRKLKVETDENNGRMWHVAECKFRQSACK
jgi:hypothetical protein